MNSKNIAIDDAIGKIRIPNYGFCNTPVKSIRLDVDQLFTVTHLYKGPKFVYAVDPNNEANRIRMTEENFRLSEDELFGSANIVEIIPEPEVVEEIKETDTMTLADLPTPPVAKEPEIIEEIVVPVETAPVIEEVVVPVEVVEPVIEETAPVAEPVVEQDDDFDDLKAETTATPESESVKEVPMKESEKKPQQNQNKPNNNYNHNNNGQKKKYTYNGGNNNKH